MLTEAKDEMEAYQNEETIMSRALRVEWLGQMAASVFWIISVFVYGIEKPGDWLQLCAASAWAVANLAALSPADKKKGSKSVGSER